MSEIKQMIKVFGAEEKCASCINLPSARETMEWLEAALIRKFPNVEFDFIYVDIDQPTVNEVDRKFVEAIMEDEYMYPLVVINDEVIAEGNPVLKEIYKKVEQEIH